MRDHLFSYGRIDLALDTFPYNGTTTTCEAMWMGVPVITVRGESHMGRVGESLLSNVGLAELIAGSLDEYIELAVRLANDRPRLAELRRSMRQRMRASPLMDGPSLARRIETAYRVMWRAWTTSMSD
jgi:protein O-GlcNAc transferase